MPEMPRPEEISNEPTRAVVDDMMQQTEQALQSSARAAAELNELRQRADDALDWKKQLNRHSWLAMGLAMAASVVVFLAFQRRR